LEFYTRGKNLFFLLGFFLKKKGSKIVFLTLLPQNITYSPKVEKNLTFYSNFFSFFLSQFPPRNTSLYPWNKGRAAWNSVQEEKPCFLKRGFSPF
jgi:hypothetical protein